MIGQLVLSGYEWAVTVVMVTVLMVVWVLTDPWEWL